MVTGNLFELQDVFNSEAEKFFSLSGRDVAVIIISSALGGGVGLTMRDATLAAVAIYDAWRCDYFNDFPNEVDKLLNS